MRLIDHDLPALLTTIEAAVCLGVRSIRYRREDLIAYVADRRRLNNLPMQPSHLAGEAA